jgi:hypothetical protein
MDMIDNFLFYQLTRVGGLILALGKDHMLKWTD